MLDHFKNHLINKFSFLLEGKLLIAISGGLDSVVLAHLCHQLKLDFALVHCNFNLRGDESDLDEVFVLEFAEDLDCEVFIESFETELFAKKQNLSIQMAARDLRYNWFNELAEQLKFDYILTAHHADDNLETFLINLTRGTGLDGLTGIPEINNNIVRSLLPFSRQEIENYAINNKLKWREDSSNASTKYLRNKLRHEVIPKLKEVNSQLLQNFTKTQEFLQGSKGIIEDRIQNISDDILTEVSEHESHFDVLKIKDLSNPKAYLYELLNEYGFTEWNDILDLLDAQSGKQLYSKTHRLLKDRDALVLTKIIANTNQIFYINEETIQTNIPIGALQISTVKQIGKLSTSIIYVDKDLLKFPLSVRKWKKGDYFYPFGMKGKKKLSKFFKDEKLSLVAKENTWLLCSENKIVWVVNHRPDNRFRVTENTQNILKITLQE